MVSCMFLRVVMMSLKQAQSLQAPLATKNGLIHCSHHHHSLDLPLSFSPFVSLPCRIEPYSFSAATLVTFRRCPNITTKTHNAHAHTHDAVYTQCHCRCTDASMLGESKAAQTDRHRQSKKVSLFAGSPRVKSPIRICLWL